MLEFFPRQPPNSVTMTPTPPSHSTFHPRFRRSRPSNNRDPVRQNLQPPVTPLPGGEVEDGGAGNHDDIEEEEELDGEEEEGEEEGEGEEEEGDDEEEEAGVDEGL